MFKRNWVPSPPIGVGLVIFAIWLVLAVSYQNKNSISAQKTAQQKYNESIEIAPLGAGPQNVRTDPKAYREEWRSEQDLFAQTRMATGTEYLVWGTWIGVILLAGTLIYTARATSAAAEASIAAAKTVESYQLTERAWVTPKAVNHEIHFGEGDYPTAVIVTATFQNSGRTPATNCEFWIEHKIIAASEPIPKFQMQRPDKPTHAIMGPGTSPYTQERAVEGRELRDIIDGKLCWYIYVRTEYRDIFSPEIQRHSEGCFQQVPVRIGKNIKSGERFMVWRSSAAGDQQGAS